WEGDDETRRRVRDLLAELGTEVGAARQAAGEAEKDRRMAESLARLRTWKGKMVVGVIEFTRLDPHYARAGREYGMDVERLTPAGGARRGRQRRIRVELAAALGDWAIAVGRVVGEKSLARGRQVLEAARDGDPDTWRQRLRDALLRREVD